MHLQCHLKDCILDYGPLHGFWCYSFERYNGLLGDLPNNNCSIEVQVMKRFIRDNAFLSCPLPDLYSEQFKGLIPHQKAVGSLLDSESTSMRTNTISVAPTAEAVFARCGISSSMDIVFPAASSKHTFTQYQLSCLKQLYSQLFSVSEAVIDISDIHQRYSTLNINTKQLGSYTSRSASSSIVMALWNPFGSSYSSTTSISACTDVEERPVESIILLDIVSLSMALLTLLRLHLSLGLNTTCLKTFMASLLAYGNVTYLKSFYYSRTVYH